MTGDEIVIFFFLLCDCFRLFIFFPLYLFLFPFLPFGYEWLANRTTNDDGNDAHMIWTVSSVQYSTVQYTPERSGRWVGIFSICLKRHSETFFFSFSLKYFSLHRVWTIFPQNLHSSGSSRILHLVCPALQTTVVHRQTALCIL